MCVVKAPFGNRRRYWPPRPVANVCSLAGTATMLGIRPSFATEPRRRWGPQHGSHFGPHRHAWLMAIAVFLIFLDKIWSWFWSHLGR